MNNENLGCKCVDAPIMEKQETIPAISANITDVLAETEAILHRVLDIINGDAECPSENERKIACFRDSMGDILLRSSVVNRLAHRLLDTFQS